MNPAQDTGPTPKRCTPQAANHAGRHSITELHEISHPCGRLAIRNWTKEGFRLAKLAVQTRQAIHAQAFFRHVAGMIAAAGRFL